MCKTGNQNTGKEKEKEVGKYFVKNGQEFSE
jgi:hypothetical protein